MANDLRLSRRAILFVTCSYTLDCSNVSPSLQPYCGSSSQQSRKAYRSIAVMDARQKGAPRMLRPSAADVDSKLKGVAASRGPEDDGVATQQEWDEAQDRHLERQARRLLQRSALAACAQVEHVLTRLLVPQANPRSRLCSRQRTQSRRACPNSTAKRLSCSFSMPHWCTPSTSKSIAGSL